MAATGSWEGAKLGVLIAVVVAIGCGLAYRFVSPAPPRVIRLAAGQPDGAYARFAERYRVELLRHGVELQIRHSAGTQENFSLLRSGEVDVALVQTGIDEPGEEEPLRSLGAMFYEPLWIFVRSELGTEILADLEGKRLDAGAEGSGTRALAERLLRDNQITDANAEMLGLADVDRVRALAEGRVDAAFVVANVDSPLLAAFVDQDGSELLDFRRAEAYARRDRTMSRLSLPEGVLDFARNIPPREKILLGVVSEMIAGPDLHPVLVDVLLGAANAVHGPGDIFAAPGVFPNARQVAFPLSPEADRYFEHGPPVLQRYLPFWVATQIDRLKVMLIPLLVLLVPLARAFPPTYRWRVRSRIYRWYGDLMEVDIDPATQYGTEEIERRQARVREIESEVAALSTPASYGEELYALRQHVGLVRRRLNAARDAAQAA